MFRSNLLPFWQLKFNTSIAKLRSLPLSLREANSHAQAMKSSKQQMALVVAARPEVEFFPAGERQNIFFQSQCNIAFKNNYKNKKRKENERWMYKL